VHNRLPGHNYQFPTAPNVWQKFIKTGFDLTANPVALDRATHGAACRNANMQLAILIVLGYQHNKRVGIRFAETPHPLEIG
jgi:hypothetical protein